FYSGGGPWVANGPNSDWVARNPNVNDQGVQPYTFFRSFDLTGLDLSTVSISGMWTIDDGGTLKLNGNQVAILDLSTSPWTSLHSFSVATGSPFLAQGVNTLTMTVTQSDHFDEGARLEGTLSGSVPEPASLSLLAFSII